MNVIAYLILPLKLQKHRALRSYEIATYSGLSRKQMYNAISQLKAVDAIKKLDGKYMLTDLAIAILHHVKEIENIEAKKLEFKLREIVKTNSKLQDFEKQKIISNLKIS